MKLKLTKMEKAWILYDVGNSAFILLVSTIIPIYFDYLADLAKISAEDYLAYWGYAASVATLVVAVIGPVFGTMADTKNLKKKIFFAAMLVGTVCCAALGGDDALAGISGGVCDRQDRLFLQHCIL